MNELRQRAKEIMEAYVAKWFCAAKCELHPVDSFTVGQTLDMLVLALQEGSKK